MKAVRAFALGIGVAGMLAVFGAQAHPAICPMIYKPVCAVRHGHIKTYANSCIARAAHARIIHNGACHPRD
ncbi:MAG: hypothetical protein ISS15_09500 [Alphaproteobacteria bacterium]|nr:hypothetical protein [Alphaproteobacteria bacterium]MBL6938762.1 hypothetical protein [Alphaproteobacteria bacterium]MBL7097881.1 hypothetical protein [Alphaproteobacteria bacterium]